MKNEENKTHLLENHLTAGECAIEAGLSRTAIYKAIDEGRLKAVHVGKRKVHFVSPSQFSSFVKSRGKKK